MRRSAAKMSGRQGAGRPQIKVLGSPLCSRPRTWPSSWAMTLRATFAFESGGVSADRMGTSASPRSSPRSVYDGNWPSARTMTTSAGTSSNSRRTACATAVLSERLARASSSSCVSCCELTTTGVKRVARPRPSSSRFQYCTASSALATRESSRSPTIATFKFARTGAKNSDSTKSSDITLLTSTSAPSSPVSSCTRSVRHGRLRHGKHRHDAIRVAETEEHSLGPLPCHLARLQVHDEQRLLADEHREIGTLVLHARQNRPNVIAEIDAKLHELARVRNVLDGDDRPDAKVDLLQVVVRDRRLQIDTSSGAVRSPPLSPVFTVPAGSISMILHSLAANGLCSTPRGTTNISPDFRFTAPSRKSMRSSPSTTMNVSSVPACECQTKSPSTRTSLNCTSFICAMTFGRKRSENFENFSSIEIGVYIRQWSPARHVEEANRRGRLSSTDRKRVV